MPIGFIEQGTTLMLAVENTNKGGWTEPQRPLRESSAGTSRAGTALMLVGENTNKG
jgi:hypothetical protein